MQSSKNTGITGKARETFAMIIDHVLRDECSLSETTRAYRWNVTGPNLYSLHRLFDEQRRQLDYWLDRVIERARAVGFPAQAPREEATPASGAGLPPSTMIGELLTRHENLARQLQEDIARLSDPATQEVLQHMVEFHETTAWMLRMLRPDSVAGSDPVV